MVEKALVRCFVVSFANVCLYEGIVFAFQHLEAALLGIIR